MPGLTDEQRTRLLGLLEELYPSPEAAFDLGRRAGLPPMELASVSPSSSPRRLWYGLLRELERSGRLEHLLSLAARDHPRNLELKRLLAGFDVRGSQARGRFPVALSRIGPAHKVQVFVSYSRKDKDLFKDLLKHLTPLTRSGEFVLWHDEMILPGERWQEVTEMALDGANLILLLISPDYLASEQADGEMRRALERHEEGRAQVIPILLRPASWSVLPIGRLEALPQGGKPLTSWGSRDEAWVDIVKGVRTAGTYARMDSTLESLGIEESAHGPEVFMPSPGREAPPQEILSIADIFSRGVQPDITFVEPAQQLELKAYFSAMGRGLVIEGPSGIGKTTAAQKAREAVASKLEHRLIHSLEPRDVAALDKALAEGFTGHLIVDDFHHLDEAHKRRLAQAIKTIADSNRRDAKITVIGINPVGATLMHDFPDLGGRFDVVKIDRQPDDRIAELIRKGEGAARVVFRRRDEFIHRAAGSFFTAQQLCYHACISMGVGQTQSSAMEISLGVRDVLGKVMAQLEGKYRQPLRDFSAYDKDQPRPGACLALLWLLRDPEGSVSIDEALLQFRMLEESFEWLREGHLQEAFTRIPNLSRLLYFNPHTRILSLEDPQLSFYLNSLSWLEFARKSGHTGIQATEDGALLFPEPRSVKAAPRTKRATKGTRNQVKGAQPESLVLHLSDLHFGTQDQALTWYGQLAQDLRELQCEELDAVVLSGDITNRSAPEEYAAAHVFLEKLLEEFQLAPRQLILVPGNHDLSWGLSKKAYGLHRRADFTGRLEEGSFIDRGEIVEVREESAYRLRFEPFSKFYEAIKGTPYPLEYARQGILHHLPEKKLLVLGLNSAWQLDHAFTKRASIHPVALSQALTTLRMAPEYEDTLKLAVWHHPLSGSGEDRIRDTGVLEQLAQAGFRLVLHGHIHTSKTEDFHYDMTAKGRRIALVSAGTFGAPVHEWVPGHPLGYNVLRIGGSRVTVETRKREELNGAWKPDARWLQGAGSDPRPRYEIEL